MGYQVLARKWRPKTFDELAGQEHVLKALVNALENQRLHHAYLFTGTRGVGKTTIARILARALNCETGVTATPCGVCSACQEINEGRFVDLIEVDAASRTKVEDTRDLLENIQYRPTRGRYKIYLIDEVHMLSTHSFNALLKTLEEPPEHVKFLLATTDPQKLPVTVLSRCLQFNLKNLTGARIQEHLQFILGEEKIPAETEALWHLARAARGSMRDALSLTDQAISHGGGKLSEDDVVSMLGTVDRKRIYELLDALVEGDAKKIMATSSSLAEFSPDYFALVEELLALMHAVAVQQTVPDAEKAEGFEKEKLSAYAQRFSPEEVQLIYQMLLLGAKDLKLAPDLHMGFEMLLLRLLGFQPAKPGEILQSQPDSETSQNDEGDTAKKSETASAADRRGDEKPSEVAELPSINQPESLAAVEHSPPVQESNGNEPAHLEEKPLDRSDEKVDQETQASQTLEEPESVSPTANIYVPETDADDLDDVPVQAEHMAAEYADWAAQSETAAVESEVSAPVEGSPIPSNEGSLVSAEGSQITAEGSLVSAEGSSITAEGSQILAEGSSTENLYVDEQLGPEPKSLAELSSENWVALFNHLPLRGMVRTLCAHLVVIEKSGSNIQFNLSEPGQKIFEKNHQDKLVQALAEHFGEPVQAQIEMGNTDIETPAEYAERRYQEKLVQAEESILQSPLVQRLVEEFGAELVPGSVHLNNPNG